MSNAPICSDLRATVRIITFGAPDYRTFNPYLSKCEREITITARILITHGAGGEGEDVARLLDLVVNGDIFHSRPGLRTWADSRGVDLNWIPLIPNTVCDWSTQ